MSELKPLLNSMAVRLCVASILAALVMFAQDPFTAAGQQAQTISTGAFVQGFVELGLVVAGVIMMFTGRLIGGLLIAVIAGGVFALGAQKWLSWMQGW